MYGVAIEDMIVMVIVIVIVICTVGFVLGLIFIHQRENSSKYKEARARLVAESRRKDIASAIRQIQYVKDPRTKICYAVWMQYHGHKRGGPYAGLPSYSVSEAVVVPEDKIPNNLLIVAEVAEIND